MPRPVLIYYRMLRYQPENRELLDRHFEVIELENPAEDTPEILEMADVVLAPLGYHCGKEKIDQCSRLKVIGSNTTGHPHIDVEYARRRRVRVITLKEQHRFLQTITPTAELTWGLLIAITRNMVPAMRSVLEGRWDRRPFGAPSMLSRMSLGIAGYGRLGALVGNYGLAFGMTVRYYDPFVDQHPETVQRVDTLQELVACSDVVSIHIPHEPETEKLFSREVFRRFKKGAFLVNTARGELIDHEALLECLQDGTLAGVAMDVFDGEFRPDFQQTIKEHPLWQYARNHDNLILTPHIGGSTSDAWRLTERHTIDLILEELRISNK